MYFILVIQSTTLETTLTTHEATLTTHKTTLTTPEEMLDTTTEQITGMISYKCDLIGFYYTLLIGASVIFDFSICKKCTGLLVNMQNTVFAQTCEL